VDQGNEQAQPRTLHVPPARQAAPTADSPPPAPASRPPARRGLLPAQRLCTRRRRHTAQCAGLRPPGGRGPRARAGPAAQPLRCA
jgi:hypothetical protein